MSIESLIRSATQVGTFWLAATLAPACFAQSQLTTPWLDAWAHATDRIVGGDASVSLSFDAPTFSWPNAAAGDWTAVDLTPFVLHIRPQPNGILQQFSYYTDLNLSFGSGVRMNLDANTDAIVRLVPMTAVFELNSRLQAPAGSQLLTAYGADRLVVTSTNNDGRVTGSPTGASPANVSSLSVSHGSLTYAIDGIPWDVSGTLWSPRLEYSALGSGHLVASSDPWCIEIGCMAAVRSTAEFQDLQIRFDVEVSLIPLSAAVPEPGSAGMLLSGLALMCAAWHRRRARVRQGAPCRGSD